MNFQFITSDFHFGHYNILEYGRRPWSSVLEMNEALVERFNSRVSNNDTVIFAGDFCMNMKFMEMYLPRLNYKRLIICRGNHDKKLEKVLAKTENIREIESFDLGKSIFTEINGVRCIIGHLPWFNPQNVDTRYDQLKPNRKDYPKTFRLHGHSHSSPDRILGNNSLDIGVDGHDWYPYSMDEIKEFVKLYER